MIVTLGLISIFGFFLTAYLLLRNHSLSKDLDFFNLEHIETLTIIKNDEPIFDSSLSENSYIEFVVSKDKKTLALVLKDAKTENQEETN